MNEFKYATFTDWTPPEDLEERVNFIKQHIDLNFKNEIKTFSAISFNEIADNNSYEKAYFEKFHGVDYDKLKSDYDKTKEYIKDFDQARIVAYGDLFGEHIKDRTCPGYCNINVFTDSDDSIINTKKIHFYWNKDDINDKYCIEARVEEKNRRLPRTFHDYVTQRILFFSNKEEQS